MAADYVNTRARDLLFTNDVNYPDPVTRVRPNPNFLAVSRFQMTGNAWSDALLVRLQRRTGPGPTFRISYTLSKAERDVEDFQFIAQDMNNLAAERGPANNDRRHQLVALATQSLPWGFQVAGYFAARSGLPVTVTTGRDNNGDTNINDRPDIVNPNGDLLNRATYDFTFTGRSGSVGRNSARGPSFAQLDLRVSKFVRFGTGGSKASSKPSTSRIAPTSAPRSAISRRQRSDDRPRFRARRGRRSSASASISSLIEALMPRFGGIVGAAT